MTVESGNHSNHPDSAVLLAEEIAGEAWVRPHTLSESLSNTFNRLGTSLKTRPHLEISPRQIYSAVALLGVGAVAGVVVGTAVDVRSFFKPQSKTAGEQINELRDRIYQYDCHVIIRTDEKQRCYENQRILKAQIDGIQAYIEARPTATILATAVATRTMTPVVGTGIPVGQ